MIHENSFIKVPGSGVVYLAVVTFRQGLKCSFVGVTASLNIKSRRNKRLWDRGEKKDEENKRVR